LVPEIEKEVTKLIEAGFIREVKYPIWIANIMPIRKTNEQLHIYVDFRDLNDACSKDKFMDGTAGYNQIQMAPKDQEAMASRTPKGVF